MTFDEGIVALATKTNMSQDEWRDFLACTYSEQMLIVKTYADQEWAQSRDTLSDVITVLETMATVAGAVSGVAGAVSALRAL